MHLSFRESARFYTLAHRVVALDALAADREHSNRSSLALQSGLAVRAHLKAIVELAQGVTVNDQWFTDLLGVRFEPRCQVHDVSDAGVRRPVLRARVPGGDGARGDADADLDPGLALCLLLGGEQPDEIEHLQAGTHRPQGVVRTQRRRAENGHEP